jgi:Retinoic acid induced 16-like protein
MHLEQMLQLIIQEGQQTVDKPPVCLNFVLTSRPLDLLVELAANDQPPGMKSLVMNWTRRLLSCLDAPPIDHVGLFQPLQRLISLCDGRVASPYEKDEILFLETVAAFVRKEADLIHLFLAPHQHSSALVKGLRPDKPPVGNTLFEEQKLEPNIRRVSLMPDGRKASENGEEVVAGEEEPIEEREVRDKDRFSKCDCEEGDRFGLFDAIFSYFDSAVSCQGISSERKNRPISSYPSRTAR